MVGQRFFPAVLKGIMTILIIVLSASFFLSLIVSFTSLTEHSMNWVVIVIAFIAMFLGGLIAGGRAKGKGLLVGASTALVFSVITFLIQYLGYDQSFTSEQYLFHGGYLLAAALGGIIGVNLSSHA